MESPLQVLVVEDRPDDVDLMIHALRKGGYSVTHRVAVTRDEFLAGLDSSVDLILADYNLPQFGAPMALQLLHEKGLDIPFLIITGSVSEETAVEMIKQGAFDYLLKDRLARLGQAVGAALDQRRLRQEARNSEQALRLSEERFRALIENAADCFMVISREAKIKYVSPSYLRLLGLEIVTLGDHDLFSRVHPDDRPAAEEVFRRQLESKAPQTLIMQVRHSDGRWFQVEGVSSNLMDNPAVRGIVINFRDVSERKIAEQALRESNRRLETALDELRKTQELMLQHERLSALGRMASGISHDFNNALMPIMGLSEFMVSHPETMDDRREAMEILQLIHSAANDAGQIVKRLREFYRPAEGLRMSTVSVADLFKQVAALTEPKWRTESQAEGRKVDLVLTPGTVPDIQANDTQMRELLTNLVINSIDAIPNGGRIELAATMKGSRVVITVSDSGGGMTDEVLQRCREPFFTTKGERGTGMGLSMAHGIVMRHGGEMEIESELGKGTRVIIRLPVPTLETMASAPHSTDLILTRKLNVLVIDDERWARELIVRYLIKDGHQVEVAGSGVEGISRFEVGTFDLVITDKAMPGMNGDEVGKAIRQLSPKVPVVMLTGFADVMSARDEKSAYADAILGKPATQKELRSVIAGLFVK